MVGRRGSRSASALVVAMVALVVAGCGGDGGNTDSTMPPSARLVLSTSIVGEHLATGDGATVYVYLPDDRGPSTCLGECATVWIPHVDGVAGSGVRADLVGSTARTDGTLQTTYDGWPLYTFSADVGAGAVSGQGRDGAWYVIDRDGSPLMPNGTD